MLYLLVLLGIIVITVIFIAKVFYAASEQALEKDDQLLSKLKSFRDFYPTQRVVGVDSNSALAFDERRRKVCVVVRRGTLLTHRMFSSSDILSVELFEDGTSVTKTVRSSQIGGVVVGGLLLGGVGAVIGGLSGKSATSTRVQRIDLRILVRDTKAPTLDFSFLNVPSGKDSAQYVNASRSARHWYGVLEVLIKESERLQQQDTGASADPVPHSASSGSLADELKKLADLHSAGFLTAEEFRQQKAKLLA